MINARIFTGRMGVKDINRKIIDSIRDIKGLEAMVPGACADMDRR